MIFKQKKPIWLSALAIFILGWGLFYNNCGTRQNSVSEKETQFTSTKFNEALSDEQLSALDSINQILEDTNKILFDEKGELLVDAEKAFSIVSDLYSNLGQYMDALPEEMVVFYKDQASSLDEKNVFDQFQQTLQYFQAARFVGSSGNNAAAATNPILNNVQLATAFVHSCAIVKLGCKDEVYCWGDNQTGAIGVGNAGSYFTTPQKVTLPGNALKIATGGYGKDFSCAIVDNLGTSELYCWGINSGQLGISTPNNPGTQYKPAKVNIPGKPKDVKLGYAHGCAIAEVNGADKMFCWGVNGEGELGTGSLPSNPANSFPNPISISNTVVPKFMALGNRGTCMISTAGDLYCWGAAVYAMTGSRQLVPKQVAGFSGVRDVTVGDSFACVIDGSSREYCWGKNIAGAFGNGTNVNSPLPTLVPFTSIPNPTPIQISAGQNHNCTFLSTTTKDIYCSGSNNTGQLADGTNTTSFNFIRVVAPANVLSPAFVSSGGSNTCAIYNTPSNGQQIYCAGLGNMGEIGDGVIYGPLSQNGTNTFKLVDFSQATASACNPLTSGDQHSCAITPSGGVKCWGDNANGQIGDGTTSGIRTTATSVLNLPSGVTAISAGLQRTCVVHNGAAKCWGANGNGQLGDGTLISRNIPTQVLGLTSGIKDISVGYVHSCVVTLIGEVKCWGNIPLSMNFHGLKVDGSGNIYVTDDHQVLKLSPTGNILQIIGGVPSASGELFAPTDIAVDNLGNILVTDSGQLLKFNSSGLYQNNIAVSQGMSFGMTSDSAGNIYTINNMNRAVKYDASGAVLLLYSPPGSGQFSTPTGMALDPSGNLYVADTGNNRIVKFNSGGSPVAFAMTGPPLNSPIGIATDSVGNVYVVDSGNNRVVKYDPNGNLTLPYIGSGQLNGAYGLHLDVSGNVYVTDSGTNRILKFIAPTYVQQVINPQTAMNTVVASNAIAVSAGVHHSCAIMLPNNTVECWRYGYGPRSVITTSSGAPLTDVVNLTAGRLNTCATLRNGSSVCWGDANTAIGNPSAASPQLTPLQVVGLSSGSTSISISDGMLYAHTCAVVNGGVKCWGNNMNGAVGVTPINGVYATPKILNGLSSTALQVASGYLHTCVMLDTGKVQCWGDDSYGNLGNGNTSTTPVPQTVLNFP